MQALLDRGISTRRGIMAAHREKPYYNADVDKRLPETNSATDNCIIFPLFHTMTDEDQSYVIDCIREIAVRK